MLSPQPGRIVQPSMDSGVNNWLANLIADSVTLTTDKIMDAGANVIVPVSRKWNTPPLLPVSRNLGVR